VVQASYRCGQGFLGDRCTSHVRGSDATGQRTKSLNLPSPRGEPTDQLVIRRHDGEAYGVCSTRRGLLPRCGHCIVRIVQRRNAVRDRQLGRCTDAVLPTLFPFEVSGDQVVKPLTVDEVIESPASSDVADHQHTLSLPTQLKITKEAADPHHRLSPGLAARVRRIEKLHLVCVQKCRRHPVTFAVVALSEPPVMKDSEVGATKRDSRRLNCASKIRREDGRESVV
jgi:hypothetical protein